MPPRRFPIPKPKKKAPEPVTAEDWLEKGIELEESGERWRSGDKIKSGRFFNRALEAYETSLRLAPLHPNFDAAYNAAHVQFVLASDTNYHENGLTKDQRLALIKRTIEGHLRAMALVERMSEAEKKKINLQDLLFNAGQSMTDYTELMAGSTNRLRKSDRDEVLRVLGEAVAMYERVWEIQERKVQEQGLLESAELQQSEGNGDVIEDGVPKTSESSSSEDGHESAGEEWAYVEEPITLESLLDTASATLEALTVRVQLIPQSDTPADIASSLTEVRNMADSLINTKLIPLVTRIPHLSSEVLIVRANFYTALAEASFRVGAISVAEYEAAIVQNFSETPIPNAPTQSGLDFKNLQTLCFKADAHIQFAAAVIETPGCDHQLAWKHYYYASQSLVAAAGVDKYEPKVQLARGDIELLRSKLKVDAATKAHDLLRRNAAVYYRGAKALAQKDLEVRLEASVKEAMLAWEEGDESLMRALGNNGMVRVLAADAVGEGLFGQEWLVRLGISEA